MAVRLVKCELLVAVNSVGLLLRQDNNWQQNGVLVATYWPHGQSVGKQCHLSAAHITIFYIVACHLSLCL